jgi:hypothetical protein
LDLRSLKTEFDQTADRLVLGRKPPVEPELRHPPSLVLCEVHKLLDGERFLSGHRNNMADIDDIGKAASTLVRRVERDPRGALSLNFGQAGSRCA